MSVDKNGLLDQAKHDRIFREKVLPGSGLYETTHQANPRVIILAGQPGAGKGGLGRAAAWEFSENIVTVDPDELRGFHPEVKNYRAARPYTWSDSTHSDASSWARELREALVKERRNVIIDTTLSNPDPAIEQIRSLRTKGNQVDSHSRDSTGNNGSFLRRWFFCRRQDRSRTRKRNDLHPDEQFRCRVSPRP